MPITSNILRSDFYSFVRRNMRDKGENLDDSPYVQYLCAEIEKLVAGSSRRMIINLPPRHLKTFVASVCLPAFFLGARPKAKVMIVSYNHGLAEEISRNIRATMRADWYKKAFSTRIAADHDRASDFRTTEGGGVFATSIDGSLTGYGADLLICDDLLDIGDARNPAQIGKVNSLFSTKVMSRLNSPQKGRVLVVAHRLAKSDLSGILEIQGGWKKIALPLIATKTKEYKIGEVHWKREKGQLLRPDSHSAADLKPIKISPDYDALYQQDPGRSESLRVKRRHFAYFSAPPNRPVVLSIDAGQRAGSANSYSVIQAWCADGIDKYLIDQWRAQCVYAELQEMCYKFIRRHRPCAAVIENTAMGSPLIYNLRSRSKGTSIIDVSPTKSKFQRFAAHVRKFRNHHIFLPAAAAWVNDYICELVDFPEGSFNDQVDATTQYLDFMDTNPTLQAPPPRALGCGIDSQGRIFGGAGRTPDYQIKGAVLLLGRRLWR